MHILSLGNNAVAHGIQNHFLGFGSLTRSLAINQLRQLHAVEIKLHVSTFASVFATLAAHVNQLGSRGFEESVRNAQRTI